MDYRDYGAIYSGDMNFPEVAVNTDKKTQVYNVTHDRAGNRLPYRNRSFISFSFGDKWIEDFGLIATITGDSLSRNASASFEDIVVTNEVIDGEFYYGTHYKSNSLSLRLVSDEMDQRQLEDFKHWFSGGKIRKLVLSEHPNRAIMARVAEPPVIDMLPYEKPFTVMTTGQEYFSSSTTVYRGFIDISFTMSEPFWHSIKNILGRVENGQLIDEWEGVELFSGTPEAKEKLKDALKIIYEDGIPLSSFLSDPMIFGDNTYAAQSNQKISYVAQELTQEDFAQQIGVDADGNYIAMEQLIDDTQHSLTDEAGEVLVTSYPITSDPMPLGYYNDGITYYDEETETYGRPEFEGQYWVGATVEDSLNPDYKHGIVYGPYITTTDNSPISLANNGVLHFYYSGTAPSPVKLSFTVPIITRGQLITTFNNMYTVQEFQTAPYSLLVVESTSKRELRLTTPNLMTSYNKVIRLLHDLMASNKSTTWEQIRKDIRDNIRHAVIRKIAIDCINAFEAAHAPVNYTAFNNMALFLDSLVTGGSLSVVLNAKTGEATGSYIIRSYTVLTANADGVLSNTGLIGQRINENIGDMLQSNPLILTERNSPVDNIILVWSETSPTNSYKLINNLGVQMSNVSIEYSNLYY